MTNAPATDDYLLIGQISSPFGVRGQMKMRSLTAHPEYLGRRITTLYLGPKRQQHTITAIFEHKPGLFVLTLGGVSTREGAEALRGAEIFIREHEAAPLDEGEYFLHQLYGLTVITDVGEELGTVREVLETGANEVLVVARPGKPEVLIPMIQDVVQEIDIANRRLVVHIIAGLLDM